jgi:hypothetical protein
VGVVVGDDFRFGIWFFSTNWMAQSVNHYYFEVLLQYFYFCVCGRAAIFRVTQGNPPSIHVHGSPAVRALHVRSWNIIASIKIEINDYSMNDE